MQERTAQNLVRDTNRRSLKSDGRGLSRKIGDSQKNSKKLSIRQIEEGYPLKRIARAHNVDPALVRARRAEPRDFAPLAFLQNGSRRFTKEIKEAAVKRLEAGAL